MNLDALNDAQIEFFRTKLTDQEKNLKLFFPIASKMIDSISQKRCKDREIGIKIYQ